MGSHGDCHSRSREEGGRGSLTLGFHCLYDLCLLSSWCWSPVPGRLLVTPRLSWEGCQDVSYPRRRPAESGHLQKSLACSFRATTWIVLWAHVSALPTTAAHGRDGEDPKCTRPRLLLVYTNAAWSRDTESVASCSSVMKTRSLELDTPQGPTQGPPGPWNEVRHWVFGGQFPTHLMDLQFSPRHTGGRDPVSTYYAPWISLTVLPFCK